jgi:hypothetical protein
VIGPEQFEVPFAFVAVARKEVVESSATLTSIPVASAAAVEVASADPEQSEVV